MRSQHYSESQMTLAANPMIFAILPGCLTLSCTKPYHGDLGAEAGKTHHKRRHDDHTSDACKKIQAPKVLRTSPKTI